jgi:SAM-dependent methyltransferase
MAWKLHRVQRVPVMDVINRRLYARNLLPRYLTHNDVTPAERVVLERYRSDCADAHVLELGCGAGRLAAPLVALTSHYEGVDISPHMIAHCRARFPTARFAVADMRQLDLAPTSVATVFAIANLIDAVDHADRLRVLAAIYDALAPGGLFVFSTHNRHWREAGAGPRLELGGGHVIRQLRDFAVSWWNRERILPFERATSEYALLNDSGHSYSVLHYYIDRAAQARQLDVAGFRLLETIDEHGATLRDGDDARDSSSLMYVARR